MTSTSSVVEAGQIKRMNSRNSFFFWGVFASLIILAFVIKLGSPHVVKYLYDANQFYILTHPEHKTIVENRMQDILQGRNPSREF